MAAVRSMQLKQWKQQPHPTAKPPTAVAEELGISRQAVHLAIRKGHLEAIRILDGSRLLHYVIPAKAVEQYKRRMKEELELIVKRLTALG